MTLSICSINCNGLRDNKKRHSIFHWFDKKNFDIILLQETHCKDEFETLLWGKQWGGASYWNNGNSSSRGVAILIKKHLQLDLTNKIEDNNGRFISISLNIEDKSNYRISNIYSPNNGKTRKSFFKELNNILSEYNTNHVIAGDYNCVFNKEKDRKSNLGAISDQYGLTELKTLISDLDLEDVWRRRYPTKTEYTFSRASAKSRLDYFLSSRSIDNELDQVKIRHFQYSDHDAISLRLNTENIERGPGLWKLNASILENSKYKEIISTFWCTWKREIDKFESKRQWWDLTKRKIKAISIDFCKEQSKKYARIKNIEIEIQKLKNKTNYETMPIFNKLSNEINEYYNMQANAARIRSKANFIEKNEKSSKYFFSLEKQRGKQKLWSKIKCSNGEMKFDITSILNEQVHFYKKLFTSEGIDSVSANVLLSNIETKVEPETARELESDLNINEIETAIYKFKKCKSPGEDGIIAEWYQTFWPLIKNEFILVIREILNENKLASSQCKGILSLIYKKGERENLKNWRPLTLLNVDYKIIAKCFALRFKPLLPSLINSNQKGYVNGRFINESNRLIQDIITYADTENIDGLIVFLDQTKAFDRVEWPWVKMCLQRFGFGEKTVDWVNMLLKSSLTAIQTNGFVSEYFSISRSIKQGCPVAPILYILQAEAMACAVRNDANIEGLSLPIHENKQLYIKLNQYVDDTQFFLKNDKSLPHLFKQLKLYETASGAKMNKEKTTALYIGKSKKKTPTFNEKRMLKH